MITRFLASLILATVILSLGACQMPQRGPAAQTVNSGNTDQPSLGYLEHRGRRHALRDLLDPVYRATSDDPAARNFDVADYHARRSLLSADIGGGEHDNSIIMTESKRRMRQAGRLC